MEPKICACCGQSFPPDPRVKNQTYCSSPACQADRRKLWRQSLVDLGCGTGAVLAEFSAHFDNSIGIDISQDMLNVAESKNIRDAQWHLQVGTGSSFVSMR